MKTFAIGCAAILAVVCNLRAGVDTNKFATLATKRGTFTNAAIRSVSGGYAIVIYDGGGQRIPLSDLPDAVRKRYPANVSAEATVAATEKTMMSPAEYLRKQNDPEVLLRQVNSQIGTLQGQIAAIQRTASEMRYLGSNPQMPSQQATLTPITTEMFLSPGTPHAARSTIDVYNDQLQGLLKFRDQLQQMVLARQRSQVETGN